MPLGVFRVFACRGEELDTRPVGRGESRRGPPVEEISSAAFSTETSDLSGAALPKQGAGAKEKKKIQELETDVKEV